MLTFLVFISFEAGQQIIIQRYSDRKSCGDDMDRKISLYYPEGFPDELYAVCDPTNIIGTSQIPPLRNAKRQRLDYINITQIKVNPQ